MKIGFLIPRHCYTEIRGYLLGTRSESRVKGGVLMNRKLVCHHCCFVHLLSHVQLFCNPVDCSPSDSSVQGISQARILKWVAISFSRDLSDPGMEPRLLCLLHWQVDSLPLGHLRSSALATGLPEFPGWEAGVCKLSPQPLVCSLYQLRFLGTLLASEGRSPGCGVPRLPTQLAQKR